MLHPVSPKVSASRAVAVPSVLPAKSPVPATPRFLRALPTVAASGLALSALFKPAVAQAQGFLPEEAIRQMSAAVGGAVFSPSTALIGGAALLATGYVSKKIGARLTTSKLRRLLENKEGLNATSLKEVLELLNKVKDRELFKKLFKMALGGVSLENYNQIYSMATALKRLTPTELREAYFSTRLRAASRSPVAQIKFFIAGNTGPIPLARNDLELFNYLLDCYKGVGGFQTCSVENLAEIALDYSAFLELPCPAGRFAAYNALFKNFIEQFIGSDRFYFLPGSLSDFVRTVISLAQKAKGIPDVNIVDYFINQVLDGKRVQRVSYDTVVPYRSMPPLTEKFGNNLDLSDAMSLLACCRESGTRFKLLDAAKESIKTAGDFLQIVRACRRLSRFDLQKDCADWMQGRLGSFFELNPTKQEIHELEVFFCDLSGPEISEKYFRIVSRWALASGAYVKSARDYLDVVDKTKLEWVKGGLTEYSLTDGREDFRTQAEKTFGQSYKLAQQTIHSFARLNPSQDEMIEFIKMYPWGYSRIVTVYNLAKLGAIKSVEDCLALTDPKLFFNNPNGFNPPRETTNYPGGGTMVTWDPMYEENMMMARIYREYFKPLIVLLTANETTPNKYQTLRESFLKRSAFLWGYIGQEENPDRVET